MSSATYSTRAVVVRKTKLKESDLIVTLLCDDGVQVSAVAKGARKPTSSFASRLELCAVADVLLVKGRSLDIVKEVRLEQGFDQLRFSVEHSACASYVAELACKITQFGVENTRMFDLTVSCLQHLNTAEPHQLLALCAAYALKALSFAGFRPSFRHCVFCGSEIPLYTSQDVLHISYEEGGCVCSNCIRECQSMVVAASTCVLAQHLLYHVFDECMDCDIPTHHALAVLQLCNAWTLQHVGCKLKSFQFLATGGLFE